LPVVKLLLVVNIVATCFHEILELLVCRMQKSTFSREIQLTSFSQASKCSLWIFVCDWGRCKSLLHAFGKPCCKI
jgi:hypothetical protein